MLCDQLAVELLLSFLVADEIEVVAYFSWMEAGRSLYEFTPAEGNRFRKTGSPGPIGSVSGVNTAHIRNWFHRLFP